MDYSEMKRNLTELLILHEGLRLKPYKCAAGKLTIGIGRNIEDVGITDEEAFFLLKNDIDRVEWEIKTRFSFYQNLSGTRKIVLLDMCFNLGIYRFKRFKKMIAALYAGNYDKAALEMLDSNWAKQVGTRATRLSNMMKYDILSS